MTSKILVCWIGGIDWNASEGVRNVGLGPIGQAVQEGDYEQIFLLNNYKNKKSQNYKSWLQNLTSAKITIEEFHHLNPINYEEIYKAATKVLSEITNSISDAKLTFHLSPGTPAMTAIWIILAKTRFKANLIQSSKEAGVQTADIPFEISAEFMPDLLRRSDSELKRLAAGLPSKTPEFGEIIHRSEEMKNVIHKAWLVAQHSSIPILLQGESGTGKELVARAIHNASPRSREKFVPVNCGGIPRDLFESEMFGHEKGAFTNAISSRIGYFEKANGGTLFLDEIGELPKESQVKILRVLEDEQVEKVGGNKKKVDVRIISATNRDLIKEVSSGNFRGDLFHRLAVAVIKMPPLRERTGDMGALIDSLLKKIKNTLNISGVKKKEISPGARNVLIQHDWPGNVRELINTLTRAVVWSSGDKILEKDIREALLLIEEQPNAARDVLTIPAGFNLRDLLNKEKGKYLKKALEQAHGNKVKASELLGFRTHQTYNNWLKKANRVT